MEDARIRRWHRISQLAIDADELRELRASVISVCEAPQDRGARERLRTLTGARALHDQVVPLLSVEARAKRDPVVLAVLRDEVRHAFEHVDRPVERLSVLEEIAKREPDNPDQLERLAWTYYLVGAWVQAAQTLELLAPYVAADHALVVLRAAARLYRNSGRNQRALVAYRAVALRKPSDRDALIALSELMVASTDSPGSAFDPQAPVVTPRSASPRAREPARPARATASSSKTQVLSATPVPAEDHSNPVTPEQADAHDNLFASLDDDEVEASLAFAFSDASPTPPVQQPLKSSRQTRERDGLLRPPAPSIPAVVPPSPTPVALASEGRTIIELDEIRDAVTGQHAVPDLAKLGLADESSDAPSAGRTRARVVTSEVVHVIDAAKSDARTGDVPAAERRLRALLRARPGEIAGHLALVDLFRANDRLEEADTHLRAALADAPTDASHRAALLHRHALVMAARGDDGDAHELLQLAHALDPRDLVILLALGESCFARASWDSAARHLGSLATHPDVASHARNVARGLVHAAIAHTRSHDAGDGSAHYEAAIRIDPDCAPALRALAIAAEQRGDHAAAIDYFEREARATPDRDARSQLYDVLGDFADRLGHQRAEQFWREAAGLDEQSDEQSDSGDRAAMGRESVLEKLLAAQRARGAIRECAETCELLARIVTDDHRRRMLAEEAIAAYETTGDSQRADELAIWAHRPIRQPHTR